MTISNIRALKHIRYRYHNASHVMYHAIHVTAQHSQRLFQIPPQKHIKYRYHNATHAIHHVIYITLRHLQ